MPSFVQWAKGTKMENIGYRKKDTCTGTDMGPHLGLSYYFIPLIKYMYINTYNVYV